MPNGYTRNGFENKNSRSRGGRKRGRRGGRGRGKGMVVKGTIAKVFHNEYAAPVAPDMEALNNVFAAILGDDAANKTVRVASVRMEDGRTVHVAGSALAAMDRFLRGGREVEFRGDGRAPKDFPALPAMFDADMKQPREMLAHGVNRRGRRDSMINCHIKGRRIEERPAQLAAYTGGYCMRCKESVERVDVQREVMKNGKAYTKGVCAKCGCVVSRTGAATSELRAVA